MRRRMHHEGREMRKPERKTAHASAEPMSEGIVKERKPMGFYARMSDDELVAYAKAFIAEKGVGGRNELKKADQGLYLALRGRKLQEKIELDEKHRNWAAMSDGVLVAHAKAFIAEKGIGGRKGLAKADPGLYAVLSRRGLLEQVGFAESKRKWGPDEKVLAHARKFVEERGIRSRHGLEKADPGLYQALRKRKLLDAVFSDVESSKHRDAVEGLLGAMESFGKNG